MTDKKLTKKFADTKNANILVRDNGVVFEKTGNATISMKTPRGEGFQVLYFAFKLDNPVVAEYFMIPQKKLDRIGRVALKHADEKQRIAAYNALVELGGKPLPLDELLGKKKHVGRKINFTEKHPHG